MKILHRGSFNALNKWTSRLIVIGIYFAFLHFVAVPYLVNPKSNDAKIKQNWPSIPQNAKFTKEILMEFLKPLKFYKPIENIKVNEVWQLVNDPIWEIYLLSAFYDDREAIKLPIIRIPAVVEQGVKHIICLLWYRNRDQPDIVFAKRYHTGPTIELRDKVFEQVLLSCDTVPGRWPPSHVSIITPESLTSSNLLTVEQPDIPTTPQEFLVCVPQMPQSQDPRVLLEWLTVMDIFKVSKVVVYYNSTEESVNKVLDYFVKSGLVELKHVPGCMPYENSDKLSLPAAIQDCFYRNMFLYEKVIILNFDEFIVPAQALSYFNMITKIDEYQPSSRKSSSYIFQTAYFFYDFTPLDDDTSHFGRYLIRIAPTNKKVRSIIDPQVCLVLGEQSCLQLLDKYNNTDWSVLVDPKLALNNHYKFCDFDELYKKPGLCNETMNNEEITDQSILNFMDKIIQQKSGAAYKLNLMPQSVIDEDMSELSNADEALLLEQNATDTITTVSVVTDSINVLSPDEIEEIERDFKNNRTYKQQFHNIEKSSSKLLDTFNSNITTRK